MTDNTEKKRTLADELYDLTMRSRNEISSEAEEHLKVLQEMAITCYDRILTQCLNEAQEGRLSMSVVVMKTFPDENDDGEYVSKIVEKKFKEDGLTVRYTTGYGSSLSELEHRLELKWDVMYKVKTEQFVIT